jgi:isopenicillin-N epimerase
MEKINHNGMIQSYQSTFLLDPSIHFLNHGSFGACPRPVFEAYQAWQRRLERQPVQFFGRDYAGYDQQARQVLGEALNVKADDLVYIPNATYGVNVLAHSLSNHPGLSLRSGDEILTTDHEYGACNHAWKYACRKTGAKYIQQPLPLPVSAPEEIVERFWQGVTPRTRLIYLSHITSPTALRFPVEAICRRARLAGILTVIDGAHAPGQISLELQLLGADFYTGNCHKWMMAPKGAAFLYARPEVQHFIEPLVVGWGWNPDPSKITGSAFHSYLNRTGTRDPAASLTVPTALQFAAEHDWETVRQHCHVLLQQTIQRLCDLTGLPPLYPIDSEFYRQMGIAPLPASADLDAFRTRLYADFHVEIPVIEWNGMKFLRISVQGYNTPEDLEALVEAVEILLSKYAHLRKK